MLGFLGDLLGLNSGDPAIEAADRNRKLYGDYKKEGYGLVDSGTNAAKGYLGQAQGLYGGISDRGNAAAGLYDNAIGLNGAEGNAAATAAFQSSPGYQFQLDQGLQALDRSAAARGMFQSGGTGIDEMTYAQGLANQDYGNWLDRLNGVAGLQVTGAQGQAGALGDLASLSTGAAGQKLGVLGDYASGLLGANNQQASGESANKAGLSNLFGNVVGTVAGWF